ncbi:uncharacterized protein PF11_0213, partial [Apis mellifera]|uniref:Uncharacterized protein PF11_0213 n=1 Tax=Apis mellifera TaxID=7460 RepID=A0A7M7SS53_APIME
FVANTMSKKNKKSSKHKICCFCRSSQNNELEFGKFYEDGNIVTHYYCLLLSSNMQQRGKDDQGILGFLKTDIQKEIRRGKRLVCSYCKKSGATLGCYNVKCKKIFHYPCGLRAGTLNQFFGEFRSYCINHRPKQKIDTQIKHELKKTNEIVCYICYEEVDSHDRVDTMWAPCCKKNAWFHRKCVQQLAMSAGYFFKCPLCNDKKLFQKAMLEFGIFIPSQDASWELVPNAFEELLYRHDQCDASVCLCPKGRKYTSFNAKWKLTLCRTCGSQGIHMACGQLKWTNPVWECTECISILGKSKETASSSSIKDTLENVSDTDDSNSDISVGKDSPVPFISNSPLIRSTLQMSTIKLRPGPRIYKLKQLEANKEIQNINKQQTSENINMLNLTNMEQYSLQSTSSNEIFTNVSSSINKDNINFSVQHSKLQLDEQANNMLTLDNVNDIIEANKCTTLNDKFIENNENEKNYISEFKDVKIEFNKNNIVYDSISSKIEKLQNNLNQNNNKNFQMNNLNLIESDNLRKFNSQNKTKSNILDDKINHENEYIYGDFVSNIKITNVVSLAPEEFENVTSDEQKKIKNRTSQNTNSISYENDILESNLKRKCDKITMNPIISYINEPKRLKKSNSVIGETSKSCISTNALINVSSNKNNLQIIHYNENNTSMNDFNIQNRESHIQIKKNCNVYEDIVCTSNTKCLPKIDISNNLLHNKTDLTNEENTYTCIGITNDANKEFGNIKIDNNIKNCDEDVSTNSIRESRDKVFTNDIRIKNIDKSVNLDHLKSKNSQKIEQWKSQNNVEMVNTNYRISNNKFHDVYWQERNKTIDYNYSQLIPEYVRLRDLKFRVHNINNLQMILYNKFSVNINMECNISSAYTEDKNTYIFNEQSKNYQDDTKENLNPETISCKNITDDLLMNTELNINDSNVFINNNENEKITQSMFKVIENNNEGLNNENINLIDIENNFDATINYNDNYNKKMNDISNIIDTFS